MIKAKITGTGASSLSQQAHDDPLSTVAEGIAVTNKTDSSASNNGAQVNSIPTENELSPGFGSADPALLTASRRQDINPLTGAIGDTRDTLRRTIRDSSGNLLDSITSSPDKLWNAFLSGKSLTPPPTNEAVLAAVDTNMLWLRSTNTTAGELLQFINFSGDAVKKDAIRDRLSKALSGALLELPNEVTGRVVSKLIELEKIKRPTSVRFVDGKVSIDNSPTRGISNDQIQASRAVNTITGTSDNIDEDAEFVIVDTMLEIALETENISLEDIKGIFSAITIPSVKRRVLLARVLYAARKSRLQFITYAIGMLSGESTNTAAGTIPADRKIGTALVRRTHPNITLEIIKHYRLPSSSSGQSINLAVLVTLLSEINPNWNTTMVNGTLTSDLSHYLVASEDARRLFLRSTEHATAMLIVDGRSVRNLNDVVKKDFPLLILE